MELKIVSLLASLAAVVGLSLIIWQQNVATDYRATACGVVALWAVVPATLYLWCFQIDYHTQILPSWALASIWMVIMVYNIFNRIMLSNNGMF